MSKTKEERINSMSSSENQENTYTPEYLLASDAFVGSKRGEIFESKLSFLARFAKEEQWNFHDERYRTDKQFPILNNSTFPA